MKTNMEETLESVGKDHKWGRVKGFRLAIVEPVDKSNFAG